MGDYSVPNGDAVNFNFTESGYTPPSGGSLGFEFESGTSISVPVAEIKVQAQSTNTDPLQINIPTAVCEVDSLTADTYKTKTVEIGIEESVVRPQTPSTDIYDLPDVPVAETKTESIAPHASYNLYINVPLRDIYTEAKEIYRPSDLVIVPLAIVEGQAQTHEIRQSSQLSIQETKTIALQVENDSNLAIPTHDLKTESFVPTIDILEYPKIPQKDIVVETNVITIDILEYPKPSYAETHVDSFSPSYKIWLQEAYTDKAGLGDQDNFWLINTFGKSRVRAFLNQISTSDQSYQALISALVRGDSISSLNKIIFAFIEDTKSFQLLTNELSSSVQDTQAIANKLSRDNHISNEHFLLNSFITEAKSTLSLLNTINEGAEATQAILHELSRADTTQSTNALVNSLVAEITSILELSTSLDTSTERAHSIYNQLQDAKADQALALRLNIKKGVDDLVKLLNHLSGTEVTSVFPDVDYRIYIDGINVRNRITGARISVNQSNVHNSIELTSTDLDLFDMIDPDDSELYGTARIEVQMGSSSSGTFVPSRTMFFMLESREGSEESFTFWGRSLSAKADVPYADIITEYLLEEDKKISEVASDIVTDVAVDWDTIDWVIKEEFSFSEGVPLDGLQALANIGSFVIRSEDDGSIKVRDRNPVRPVNLPTTDADINYDRVWDLLTLGFSTERGDKTTEVDIDGYGTPIIIPEVELEDLPENDSVRDIGQDSYVRVFWAGKKITDSEDYGIIVTDGDYQLISEDNIEEKEEIVHFKEGKASVGYPIDDENISVTWYGVDGGNVVFNLHDKELTCEEEFAVAVITYKTKYDRYLLYDHNVKEMLFALWALDANAIALTVKLDVDSPDKKALTNISNENITTESAAIHIGTRWLDDHYYDTKSVSFSVPYKDAAVDGAIAYVNDSEIGIDGHCIIRKADIVFDGPKVTNEIEAIQWTS